MKEYYYENKGQKVGPLSKAALKGKVSKDTLVWTDGLENWIAASQLPELNDLFQKEPPPLPNSKPESTDKSESNDEIVGVKRYALLLFGFTIGIGIMEFFEMENNKFYGLMLTASVIATYYVLKNIKKYLNNILNYTSTNKAINILIVTSIILGIVTKIFTKYEDKLDDIEMSGNFPFGLVLLVLIVLFINFYYYFKLGKKLSKLGDEVTSKFSKFAYTTVLSYFVIFILSFIADNAIINLVVSIILSLPLLYLIIGFNDSDNQDRFIL